MATGNFHSLRLGKMHSISSYSCSGCLPMEWLCLVPISLVAQKVPGQRTAVRVKSDVDKGYQACPLRNAHMTSKPYTLLNLVIIPVMSLSLPHLNALTSPILLYPPGQCLLYRICSTLDLLTKDSVVINDASAVPSSSFQSYCYSRKPQLRL